MNEERRRGRVSDVDRLGVPERLKWLDNCTHFRVERGDGGRMWVELYIEDELDDKQKGRLRVKEKMPFNVVVGLDDVDFVALRDQMGVGIIDGCDELFAGVDAENFVVESGKLNGEGIGLMEKLRQVIKEKDVYMSLHGWASDHTVIDPNKVREVLRKTGYIGVLPDGLGIKGGCIAEKKILKIDGLLLERFKGASGLWKKLKALVGKGIEIEYFGLPEYASQMREFMKMYFSGKSFEIEGHSTGGAMLFELLLQVIDDKEFRNKEGEIPIKALYLNSPACPWDANVFIKDYLQASVGFLRGVKAGFRLVGAGESRVAGLADDVGEKVAHFINTVLLPDPENATEEQKKELRRLRAIHARVVVESPETVLQVMNGLLLQRDFTKGDFEKIMGIGIPIVVVGNPDDKLVDHKRALGCITGLIDKVIGFVPQEGEEKREMVERRIGLYEEYVEKRGVVPLVLLEDLLKATHYVQAARSKMLIMQTMTEEVFESPAVALSTVFSELSIKDSRVLFNELVILIEKSRCINGVDRGVLAFSKLPGLLAGVGLATEEKVFNALYWMVMGYGKMRNAAGKVRKE
ncbi:hypothetical protein KKE45_02405 [Patescibacteria group bacterium]|nr:hypothetical protein [Patescibacteria group bacterium]